MSTDQVLIVGGGAAGVETALLLRRRVPDLAVTLLSATDDVVYRPSLITLPGGGDHRNLRFSLTSIAESAGFVHVLGTAAQIDLSAGQVRLTDQTTLDYDRLVITAGAPSDRNRIRGAVEHALFPCDINDALTFADRVRSLPHGVVTIVLTGERTGPGLEYAAHLAQYLHSTAGSQLQLRVIDDRPQLMAHLGPGASRYVHRLLTARGADVQAGTAIAQITAGEIQLADGRQLPSDITAVIGPLRGPELGLPTEVCTTNGFALVDTFLHLPGHPEVTVAGDAAHLREAPNLPKSWILARLQAASVAAGVAAEARNEPAQPFDIARAQRVARFNLPDLGNTALLARDGHLLARGPLPSLLRRRLDRNNLRVLNEAAADPSTP